MADGTTRERLVMDERLAGKEKRRGESEAVRSVVVAEKERDNSWGGDGGEG